MPPPPELILASASPRRQRILADLGATFRVVVPDVVELTHAASPADAARENARRKCAWCRERHPDAAIVAADTVIDLDGILIGKPADLTAAAAMLRRFSNRRHRVLTAVALASPGAPATVQLCESDVRFRELTDADIATYIRAVNPLDKAGAYDIGERAELIIAAHTGSLTNIMGLPVEHVRPWLQTLGLMP